jgi:hypothetical protein
MALTGPTDPALRAATSFLEDVGRLPAYDIMGAPAVRVADLSALVERHVAGLHDPDHHHVSRSPDTETLPDGPFRDIEDRPDTETAGEAG